MSSRIVCRLIWVPSLVALIGILGFLPARVTVAAKPAAMVTMRSAEGDFQIDHPANWKPHETSAHAVGTTLRFAPGSGTVLVVETDLAGSLLADMDRALNSGQTPPGTDQPPAGNGVAPGLPDIPGGAGVPGLGGVQPGKRKPVMQQLHEMDGKGLKTRHEDYKEGQTSQIVVAGKPTLYTQFTFTVPLSAGGFQVTGGRCTFMSGDKHFSVTYRCQTEDKKTILPLLENMVRSIRLGQEGGLPQ